MALVLACGATAEAQIGLSLNRAGSGARAAGMGDAFIAVSDDGTAASWNPAGLAQLRQPEFSFVYVVSRNGIDFAGMRSPDASIGYAVPPAAYTNSSIDFASAAVPFSIGKKPVTVQAGWHRLYQLSTDLTGNIDSVPLDPPGPATVISRDAVLDGHIDVISLAAAVKLTGHLAVGGSVDFWRGDWVDRTTLIEESNAAGEQAFFATTSTVELRGPNFSGGILLTYPAWNVGLVYHAPFWSSFDIRGQAMASGFPTNHVAAPDARFRLPRSMGAGVARRFGTTWMVSGSLTHDQWTEALLDGLAGSDGPVNFFDGQPPSLSATRDTLSFNAGVEHLFLREGSVVPLRFGVGWEPQGGSDEVTRDPVGFLLVSAGAGYNTNRFKFDAAVQYRAASFEVSDVYTVASAINDGARDAIGRADTREWRIKVSAIYRLTDTDALRAAIRRIIG